MILTVTPNPAFDVTYDVDDFRVGHEHRVESVHERPGGKGINVARVLRALGEPVTAAGLTSAGPDGVELAARLRADGIGVELVVALPRIRRTLVVQQAGGTTTALWEPGLAPSDPVGAADRLRRRTGGLLARARALTVSGSLPPGLDPGLPALLAEDAAEVGVPAVLDLDGAALRAAVDAGVAVVTPNATELGRLLGRAPGSVADVAASGRELVAQGVPAVMATLGARGLVVVTASGAVHARPVPHLQGNATGAGDAACAGLARVLAAAGSVAAADPREMAAEALALSAAAVLRPVAGDVDLVAFRAWRPRVELEDV